VHLLRRQLIGVLYKPRMMDDDECGAVGGMIDGGKPKYSERTCPTATLSTTDPTWPDLGSNAGCHGGKRRLTA
jgi:hypothetical protein